MELITKKDELGEYVNDLTKEMDKYLTKDYLSAKSYCEWGTYIYDHQTVKNHWAIRFPGSTRGHILIDNNDIILDVVLYKDTAISTKGDGNVGCYLPEVIEVVKKFIGMKFVFIKED